MDNDDNEKLTLRDKIAIEILPWLLDKNNANILFNLRDKDFNLNISDINNNVVFNKHIEILTDLSYIIADKMRKARLKTFT